MMLLQLVLVEVQLPAAAINSTRCSNTSMLRSMLTCSLFILCFSFSVVIWAFGESGGTHAHDYPGDWQTTIKLINTAAACWTRSKPVPPEPRSRLERQDRDQE